jgi:hypothetical protein
LFEPAEDDPNLERLFDACWNSDDVQEGIRARVEKRLPQFTGR